MKKVLATLLVLCMVVGMLPAISFASDTTISAVRTAFFNSSGSEWKATDGDHVVVAAGATGWTGVTEFTDSDGTVTTQASLSGSPFGSARNALIAFTIPDDFDPATTARVTLSMKIKNVKQTSSGARLSVYGNSIDDSWSTSVSTSVFGVNGADSGLTALPLLGLTDAIQAGNSQGEVTSNQIVTLSSQKLTDYVCQVAEEGKKEVTFRLACTLGGIRIYDTTTSTPPTLTLTYGAKASLQLTTSYEGYNDKTEVVNYTNLYADDIFEVTEEIAPKVVLVNGDGYYMRDDISPVTLQAGENTLEIVYKPIIIASADLSFEPSPVIEGGKPALPSYLTVTTEDGAVVSVPAKWTANDDGTYTAELGDIRPSIEIPSLPCDSVVEEFVYNGASDGASFESCNDLGINFNGGTFIADTYFTTTEGTNKLIAYGNDTTSGFSSTGALIRYMNTQTADGYVFEYYNDGWLTSDVLCEYGVDYILRMEVDVTNNTYIPYISANGGSFVALSDTACAFRGTLTGIDRVFYFGDVTVTDQRASWTDGYSLVTINSVADEKVINTYKVKTATGLVYTASYLPLLVEADDALYMRTNRDKNPSIVVTGAAPTLNVAYEKVSVASYNDVTVVAVQGEPTINLPASLKIKFSNNAEEVCSVEWDTEEVDTDIVDTYTVTGYIEGTNATIEATVKVREVTILPKTSENTVVTNNGGWNWYVEPSGTHIQPGDELATRYESGIYSSNNGYVFQNDRTYMGWVEDGGDIVIGQYDHVTDEYTRVVIHEKLESDDHNNPAVVILPDGRIMAVYSMHTNEAFMYYRVTKNPEDISEWNDEQYYLCKSVTSDDTNVYYATYPSVFMVHDDEGIIGNDVIYMGWRGVHWKPTFAKFSMPDENGKCETIMNQTQFANTTYGYSTYDNADAPNAKTDGGKTDAGRRPYTKYDYDFERNKIYITFTANHPDNDKRNHIYYIYLDIEDQNLYTAKDNLLQPLPFENQQIYRTQGASGTNGQWGIITVDLVDDYPELLVFNASEQTGESFNPRTGNAERRGWTWDITHNEKGEPCIVYVDVTATPPNEDGSLPTKYLSAVGDNSRSHHYYWYARWDSETQTWVKTFLTYGGKWWHENATQERCYSGGLTFDHNATDANVIYLSIPTMGEYGNMFEIYRWESEDHGATWTIREALTENSKACNARPNAIYNYKMDSDGRNLGPRLLWIQGEYRYWMNYEYKTGVMTDFANDGFITQDDPEMFADAALYADGEKLEKLPTGEATVTAKFNITNISIGDGTVTVGIAHYDKDNLLKNVYLERDVEIPARSVPQTGIIGAPKREDGSLSRMGDDEIKPEIEYTATFEEGDKIKLLCWNMGIEHPYSSIMTTPFTMTTDGDGYIFKENFTYEGDDILILDNDESTFNGWVGNRYYDGSAAEFTDSCYAAITKAPFGNTGLHLYRNGDGGVMASHSLPDTNGKDFELKFTIRYINELSWNNTSNAGFSLSNNIPGYANNIANASCAFQFRHGVEWQDENGRGTNGYLRRTRWFDGNVLSHIFHGGIPRDMETDGLIREDYHKGIGYFDPEKGFYIHDYNDALMAGSLYYFTVRVSPSNKTVTMSIHDGYREITHTESYVDKDTFDWDNNPINSITFSIGNDNKGEMYVDDITMKVIE